MVEFLVFEEYKNRIDSAKTVGELQKIIRELQPTGTLELEWKNKKVLIDIAEDKIKSIQAKGQLLLRKKAKLALKKKLKQQARDQAIRKKKLRIKTD